MELKKANTKALIFIGVTENFPNSTAALITNYLVKKLKENEVEVILYNVSSEVPLLDMTMSKHPNSVEEMVNLFLSTELHFWLAPLYHGSIPGIMKNSLDWLEITSKLPEPYLLDKRIGLISWADGINALNGITTMENVTKSLRAWPLPYSVSIEKNRLRDLESPNCISSFYTKKLDRLLDIALSRKIEVVS